MNRFVWVNEGLTDTPAIDPRDRGFTLGDGLFETVRALGGRLPLLPPHLARLRTSAQRIDLPLPWTDAFLTAAISSLLSANTLTDAAVRLTVSRGVPSRRGLLPDPQPVPTLVIDATPFPGYPPDLHARGADLVTSRLQRDERSPLAAVKSLSRLEHVLARQDAARAGADEALILNASGRLAGASAANLFVMVGGRLLTPPPGEGALPGIIRGLVLTQLAPAAGLASSEEPLTPDDLRRADEAFLTNALLGLLPVASVDGERIGSRRSVGPSLAQLLSERLREG